MTRVVLQEETVMFLVPRTADAVQTAIIIETAALMSGALKVN
jgi:hypothetical protein